jgi:hypothetical protein
MFRTFAKISILGLTISANALAYSAFDEVAEMLRSTRFAEGCTVDVNELPGSQSIDVRISDEIGNKLEFVVSEDFVRSQPSEFGEILVVSTGKIGLVSYWQANGMIRDSKGDLFKWRWLVNDDTRESEVFKLVAQSGQAQNRYLNCGI